MYMNPSYNGTFGNKNADEPAHAPVFGAGVNNTQPVQPVQPIQPAAPMTPQQPILSQQSAMPPQQPIMTSPISPATGDIVIGGSEKKSHKGLIIGVVIAVLVIGGLAAATFLMPKNSTSTAAKEAFNKYANYLLYGEDSTSPLEGEYNEDGIYKIDEINEGAETTEYLKKSGELLDEFILSIKNNTGLTEYMNKYKNHFELEKIIISIKPINEDALATEVLNNDLDTAKNWITSNYLELTKSNNEEIRQYAQAKISYYGAQANYLNDLKTNGCLENADSCAGGTNEELISEMIEQDENVSSIEINARLNVFGGCWTISEKLNGGSES